MSEDQRLIPMASENPEVMDWRKEAHAVGRDIKDFVCSYTVCEGRRFVDKNLEAVIYIVTKEGLKVTVDLGPKGFKVAHEEAQAAPHLLSGLIGTYFETPYALLSAISPSYPAQFASQLQEQLEKLDGREDNPSSTSDDKIDLSLENISLNDDSCPPSQVK